MAAGIDLFRWCVLPGRPFPGASLGLATIIVVGLLGASLACFRTIEKTVTDSI
jgi:ABC-type polysaccharide/polyol phosphate export permease